MNAFNMTQCQVVVGVIKDAVCVRAAIPERID